MNDYRFINIDQEPSEEQLAQLMHEVAVEAKERHDRAHEAFLSKSIKWRKLYEKTCFDSNSRS